MNTEQFSERWTPEPYSGCWLWTRYCNACGYGWMARKGKYWMAHRYAWTLYNGEIPEGVNVCHKCDTPACVNPDHLFLGIRTKVSWRYLHHV